MQLPEKRPYNLSFIVTHECNLRCVYCYESNRDNAQLDADQVKRIISEYLNNEKYGSVQIDFFGGEPWLKFDLIKEVCEWVWERQWKNKYLFFTTTNGTLVHGEVKEWLGKNKERFWCGLSLDGTRETHNKNRSNSFDKIDLDFFLECWPKQTVKMTISPLSIDNFADDIIFIQEKGFLIAGTNFAEGIDWNDKKYLSIVSKQLEKLVRFYLDNPQYEIAQIINLAIEHCESPKKAYKWCGTGDNMGIYDIDGKHYPCSFFTPMTFKKEQLDALKSIDFSDHSLFVDKYCADNCYLFNICPNCYGANYLVNGKFNERDKSRCNLVKLQAYYASALQAQKIIAKSSNIEVSEKNKVALQIRAIEKINDICQKELFIE